MAKLLEINSSGVKTERFAIETVVLSSADFTAVADDHTYYSITTSAAPGTGIIVTLPSATTARVGMVLTFKRRGTRKVVINRAGSDTIDGDTSVEITADKAWLSLIVIANGQWELTG